jgi:CHAT domain-containing protein/Tfp pilus assembly protein PilF
MAAAWRGAGAALAVLSLVVAARGEERPPWQRLLKGDDARQAAALGRQVGALVVAGKFAEAAAPAAELLELRRRAQGEGHWQTADAGRELERLKYLAAQPAAVRERAVAANRRNQEAIRAGQRGDLAAAAALFRQALADQRAALGEDHHDTAGFLNNLGATLYQQHKPAEAEPLFRQALAVRRKALGERHPLTAASLSDLATSLEAQDKHAEAEPLVREALAARRAVLGSAHPLTATSLNNLAACLGAQGKYAEAEALHRQVLAVRRKALGEDHPDTAFSWANLGAVLRSRGDYRGAEAARRRALAIYQAARGRYHPETFVCTRGLALVLHEQGKYAEAEPLWRASADAFEAVRLRAGAGGFDRAPFAAEHSPYLVVAPCLARLGKAEDAWRYAEEGLARGLLDDLTAAAGPPPSPDERRQEQGRLARLDRLDRLVLALLTARKRTDADTARLAELTNERDALQAELARAAADRARGQVYGLARVQGQLAPDEAFVFWVDLRGVDVAPVPGGEHWACVVRRRGPPAWVRLPGGGDKEAWTDDDARLVARLRDSLAGGEADWQALARRLARQRLAPLGAALAARGELPAARRLVAVPAGWMAGLPLEVLGERYPVSYAPSGTVFARLREKHRPLERPTLLALGDPAFGPPGAPDRGTIKPLPASRYEVNALRALFPSAEVLLGREASAERLAGLARSGRLKDFRVLHFATHGELDEAAPARSALLLARTGPAENGGRLTVAAIARNWELDADLVTLSACQTALGRRGGGEGLLGFAQVLFQKGARGLLLSLWKVDDTATALLMARFYENLLGRRAGLKAPLGKAEALREARSWLRGLPRSERDRLAAGLVKGELRGTVVPGKPVVAPAEGGGESPYAHPRYWAAFILLGDPD